MNPFKDARLRKRSSWKHALSNPAETITKRKTYRSRQSSIRTESPHPANSPSINSPLPDKKDEETKAGGAPLAASSDVPQLQNISTPQTSTVTATGSSTGATETYPYPRSLQLELAAVTTHENKELGEMMVSDPGQEIGNRRDSQDLTEEAVQNRPYSPVPMERFLESTTGPCEDGNFIGLRDHFVLASVQENDDSDTQGPEQPMPQKKQEESPDSESPPSRHPQIALQGQNKKAVDFPADYWQWDRTRQKHYHRDEDTGSVASYGPLD